MTSIKDYDIVSLSDNREFIFFNQNTYDQTAALEKAKEIVPTIGYGDQFDKLEEKHVSNIWVEENKKFEANPNEAVPFFYSDPSNPKSFVIIAVELVSE